MEELLLDLLRRLEAVGDRDKSLYDTVVREAMGDPIFFLFIKPTPGYAMADDYGMAEDDNLAIKAALRDYIEGALSLAPSLGLNTFHKRLSAFQSNEVYTGANYFDDFFGWSDPAAFDEAGDVIRRG
jgi:hypothetical protein